ncbi:hypothetical protein ACIO6U_02555 [Streptomyces sp. NPDC087422]|uniref:hypothetical protein n=1 Tax=Streptomyces sp. NPDC087422 TaxID=3365786 RepID=UPI0037F627E7
MPTSKTSKDPAEEAAAESPQTHTTAPGQSADADDAGTGPEPGVYEYTHGADCVYPQVPLTARAANPGRPESEGDPGESPVTATVFNWPFGPPDDGRWTTTRKKPNQAADNDPAPSSEE